MWNAALGAISKTRKRIAVGSAFTPCSFFMPPFFFCFLSFLFVFSFSYCSVKSPAPQTRKNGQDKRPGEKGSKEIKQREETGVSEGKEGCRKEDNDAKSTRKERGKDE